MAEWTGRGLALRLGLGLFLDVPACHGSAIEGAHGLHFRPSGGIALKLSALGAKPGPGSRMAREYRRDLHLAQVHQLKLVLD